MAEIDSRIVRLLDSIQQGTLGDEARKDAELYVQEAAFFWPVVTDWIDVARADQRVVELGSGIGLIALLLADEGVQVTAFEPEASGFTNMLEVRDFVVDNWPGPVPPVDFVDRVASAAEVASIAPDVVFAINVLEHVADPATLVADVLDAAGPGCRFHFVCPNYRYPFEPHFNLPTMLSKRWTERLLGRWIRRAEIANAATLWAELSWPNPWTLRRTLERRGVPLGFRHDVTLRYLDRVRSEPSFRARKGRVFVMSMSATSRALHQLLQWMPASWMPVTDAVAGDVSD